MEPRRDPGIGHISTQLTGRIQNNSLSTICRPNLNDAALTVIQPIDLKCTTFGICGNEGIHNINILWNHAFLENISMYLLKKISIRIFTQTRYSSGMGSIKNYQKKDNYNPDQGGNLYELEVSWGLALKLPE